MMNEMLLTTLVSTVTAVSGFIYGVQKNKKDLISQSLNNLQQQITIYQDVISSLRGEIEHLISKVNEQEKIIQSLEKKIDGLKPKVKTKVIE
jgi:peptidoglycan hydrolase CwlO-like protein